MRELGLCWCGCGEKTTIAKNRRANRPDVAGQPHRYVQGHQFRKFGRIEYVVEPTKGCWIWQGSLNNKGYGTLTRKGKRVYAHVLYYEKAKGPVPEGLELHHKCENPPCVNPKHLKPVTHKINMRLNRHTKLNEIKVRKIRKLSAQGMSYLEIAKLFGVGESTVGHAVLGNRNWKDVK